MMAATQYGEYTKDRVGWFFGMTGPQLAVVTISGLPLLLAVGVAQWGLAAACLAGWGAVLALVLLPVRGRTATQWLSGLATHTLGRGLGWSTFAGRASLGEAVAPDDADLPGILSGIEVHDGPPRGAALTRVAVIQDHAAQTWAATARVVHPGLGSAEGAARTRMGEGHWASASPWLVMSISTSPGSGFRTALWTSIRGARPALTAQRSTT